MSAVILAVWRFFPPRVWLALGLAALAGALLLTVYVTGRNDQRADQTAREQKAEARAAAGRETAAGERAADTLNNHDRLKEWNHDAEQTPDAVPDARDLRRRCRQLRDAGRDLPQCRGPEG